ncbi:MAG: BACON domain-containing protein [Bacteroidaceae bacterium]|nr:BACON domain-containing protein [Bacteroidaceae bacterium]
MLAACSPDDDITQPTVSVNPTDLNLAAGTGESVTFEIRTDYSWSLTIEDGEDWLKTSSRSGTGKTTITLHTMSANESIAERSCIVVVTASNDGCEAKDTVRVTQAALWEPNCEADMSEDLHIVMCYGIAGTLTSSSNTSYVLYNVYERSRFNELRGNNEAIYQEATKSGSDWERINITSSGAPEFVYNDCEPGKNYTIVFIAFASNGKHGSINSQDFSTPSANDERSALATIMAHEGATTGVNEDGVSSSCYAWDISRGRTTTGYYTYICASTASFTTMEGHKGGYAEYHEPDGIKVAWKIFLDHISDNFSSHSTSFNYGSGVRKEYLFNESNNNATIYFSASPSDKYVQIVTWSRSSNGMCGLVYDMVYEVENGQLKTSSPYSFTVSTTSLSFEATGGTKTVSLGGNDNWTATCSDNAWISCQATGTSPATINITVSANNGSSRQGKITFKGTNSGRTYEVSINQKGNGSDNQGSTDVGRDEFDGDADIDNSSNDFGRDDFDDDTDIDNSTRQTGGFTDYTTI